MIHDEDHPRPAPVHVIGQDLAALSIDDLDERIGPALGGGPLVRRRQSGSV